MKIGEHESRKDTLNCNTPEPKVNNNPKKRHGVKLLHAKQQSRQAPNVFPKS